MLLTKVINLLKDEGHIVVRLDKREIPDAFYIEDGKPIAIEIETDVSKPYSRHSQFESVLLISKKIDGRYHKGQTYTTVLKLRKEGKSYNEIQREMANVHGLHIPVSLIHNWCKGKQKPPTVYLNKNY